MDRAEAAGLVSHEALQTALNLMDPFPDGAAYASGWHDNDGVPSVPLVITDYTQIAAPAGTVNNWHFKVAFLPNTNGFMASKVYSGIDSNGVVGAISAASWTFAHFAVWTWKDTDPEPSWFSTPAYALWLDVSMTYVASQRICAAGFELINSSTELNKGGYQYASRMPTMLVNNYVYDASAGAPTTVVASAPTMYSLPNSLDDIVNWPTTFSGPAVNGLACFSTPISDSNPPTPNSPNRAYLGNYGNLVVSDGATAWCPWNTCVAYVTGQVPGASWTLKGRIYWEVYLLSNDDDRSWQSVSRPAVPYSPVMREMLSATLRLLPSGFDYSENPFGEWFHGVLKLLSHAVPTVGGLIPHPAVRMISAAASPVLRAAAKATEPSRVAHKEQLREIKREVKEEVRKAKRVRKRGKSAHSSPSTR